MFQGRRLQAGAAAIAIACTLIVDARASSDQSADIVYSPELANLNLELSKAGINNMRIDTAELSVIVDGVEKATTLIANNRTHQIGSQFVPRDPRRGGLTDLSYLVDQSDGEALAFKNATGTEAVALPNSVTEPIIDRAMLRWQNSPHCPGPAVTKLADDGTDPDMVDGLVARDPSAIGVPKADITHAGWLPLGFLDTLLGGPGATRNVLGITFTLVFSDDDGPTDIDHNGRSDTALREIYYNKAFGWSEGASRPRGIDIESVATHESGHAFGLGHFGKIFFDHNGVLKFAPRAVMTAVYAGPFTELTGTDNASFCSIWARSSN